MNPAKTPVKVSVKTRLLTAAEFQRLAEVPPEAEWFRNIRNSATKRAYENAIKDFMRFAGIRRPEEFRTVTPGAWPLLPLSQETAGPTSLGGHRPGLPRFSDRVIDDLNKKSAIGPLLVLTLNPIKSVIKTNRRINHAHAFELHRFGQGKRSGSTARVPSAVSLL